jgi:hypothetical protein
MSHRRALILLAAVLPISSITIAQQSQLGAGSTNLQSFRGETGRRLALVCPPGRPSGDVYGTDVYTDDSSVCAAAVHAGAITSEKGGPVTVVIGGEQKRYQGSSRNGVTSREFAAWPGSFSFDQKGRPGRIAWHTTAKGAEGYSGSVTVICPQGGKPQNVWGTGPYTSDSSVCSAAVHAGVITLAQGGPVTIRITEGKEAYEGSSRNGVVTRKFGIWDSSFEVLASTRQVAADSGSSTPARATLDSGVAAGVTPKGTAQGSRTVVAPTQTPDSSRMTTAAAPNGVRSGAVQREDTRSVSGTLGPAPKIVSATGFKGVAGPKYSQLSWNSAPGAVGYGLTRYDPTTQQRITLRAPNGDTVFAQTAYLDSAVTPNRTYGYRLRTHFQDQSGELVTDPDTSQGVTVTPKDAGLPIALPANFQDSIRLQYTLSPPDPNRPHPQQGDTMITLSWDWRTGAEGYRITVAAPSEMTYLVGWNGNQIDYESIRQYGKNTSESKFVGPYASTQFSWPRILKKGGYYVFCVFASSPIDPTTGKRRESRPGIVKLKNSDYETGGKWEAEQITFYGGQNSCPITPTYYLTGK